MSECVVPDEPPKLWCTAHRQEWSECRKAECEALELRYGRLLKAADALLSRIGSQGSPVGERWEKEFLDLELLVADNDCSKDSK